VFDGLQAQLAANRSQFYRDLPAGPFYGYNRPGAKVSGGCHPELVAPGHDGRCQGALRRHRGLFPDRFYGRPEEDHRPVLVMHGDDDQIVPYVAAGPLSAKPLKNGTLKTYKGFPHGMPTTEADTINSDLLAFIKS
jgi:non-heme chloroperoxidase